MMSTATKTTSNNYKSNFSFDSKAKAEHAAQYINDMIKGAVAIASSNKIFVQAKTKSSLNEAEELLHDLGGQHIKH